MTDMTQETTRQGSVIKWIFIAAIILAPLFIALNALLDIDAEHGYKSPCYAITERYYSPSRGTSLELCNGGEGLWQGRICRITGLNGTVTLTPAEAYECTILAAKRTYWDGVIIRDGYGPFPPELDGVLRHIPIGGE